MAGTKQGGLAAAASNYKNNGKDFYKRIGAMGGSTPKTKPHGFLYMMLSGDTEKIREAGARGGTISRRGKASTTR